MKRLSAIYRNRCPVNPKFARLGPFGVKRDRADRAFDGIGIDLDAAIVDEAGNQFHHLAYRGWRISRFGWQFPNLTCR